MRIATLLTTLLTANLVLGARFTQRRREAREARAASLQARKHKSQPLGLVDESIAARDNKTLKSHYSQNWAGALLIGAQYTAVTGTIIVPTPTGANAAVQSAGAAWVGIDGGTCPNAILQTGIDWYVTAGKVTYDAWYEWYPDYSYDFSGITLKGGDSVRLTVITSSTTAGYAVIENLTTGQRVQQALNVAAGAALCEANAEWIIEDFQSCDSSGANCGLVQLANFGSVTFSNAFAFRGGTTVYPSTPGQGLMVLDMYQNSKVLTNCAVSGATVGCTYVP